MVKVEKRNGELVDFDESLIFNSIFKACINGNSKFSQQDAISFADGITDEIVEQIDDLETDILNVEDIQNIVINNLFKTNTIIANDYAYYKTTRDVQRMKSRDINVQVQKLVNRDSQIVHENANKDSEVFSTLRDLTAGVTAKAIGLSMLPPHVAMAHENGDIHFHDLDYSPYAPLTNCCLIDFKGMFENGFKIGNAKVSTPNSIQTATAQMAQIFANVASSQYGGCSADRIDEVLAPYAEKNYRKHLDDAIRYEIKDVVTYAYEKTVKDIYDAMQSLEYEINTLYTSNGQTPFTTLGFGLGTSPIERTIQESILKIRIKGLGEEGKTAIFPKLIFTLKDGVNLKKTDPNYDIKKLALECSAKRMYPDILSYDKIVELTGSFKVPMGCRSFLQGWKDENGNEVNSGRMNLGVVTLNLPRIAIESKGDMDRFWNIFHRKMSVVGDALKYRVKRVKEAKPKNAPILYMDGAFGKRLNADGNVDELFKNKRATVSIGYIGLYEVASVFFGSEWETNPIAKEFTLKIVKTLKQYADIWGDEQGYHYSVYSTPSESLTDRFCRMDKEKYGVIENVTDKDYYTNSFHYDVRKKPTPFQKIDFEKDYPKYCSGGFIHYCEYPVLTHNLEALEAVWDYAYDKVGYLGTNTPIDKCFECGFEGEFNPTERGFECPNCHNHNPKTCDVVKRTCGYLGNPQQRPMAYGRHKEISARVKHMKGDLGHVTHS